MANKHLIHAHSSVVTEGQPKLPSTDRIEYGELAVNFAEGYETISLKNSNNNIVTFSSDDTIRQFIVSEDDTIRQFIDIKEKVVSHALNDLNSRIISNGESISELQENFGQQIEDVIKTLDDDGYVISSALNDLNERINDSDNIISELTQQVNDNVVGNAIKITYSNLKAKRDNGELKPGQLYQITDYVTTTSQEFTRSANLPFDIIVLALTSDTISEDAKAVNHENTNYFNGAKLEAWDLKYCLDNDSSRFLWADTTNGKGVIYYMKDEWNNECPYDFKNIQFERFSITDVTSSTFTSSDLDNLKTYLTNDSKPMRYGHNHMNTTINDITFVTSANDSDFYYTFSLINQNEEIVDASIYGNNFDDGSNHVFGTHNNVIKQTTLSDEESTVSSSSNTLIFVLNNIVLCDYISYISDEYIGIYNNTFENGCYENTISGHMLHNNKFENYCYKNILCCGGDAIYSNTFKSYFNFNIGCMGFYENAFGEQCNHNIFNQCDSSNFGSNCMNNTFLGECFDNVFGNNCESNTFKTCEQNTFGNRCQRINFANNITNIMIGNSCTDITLEKEYSSNIIVEDGNMYITITSTQTPTSQSHLQNIKIGLGTNQTSTLKTISHNTLGDTFTTTYQPSGSTTVDV